MLVKRLLGSYPSLNLHDPEVYIAECAAVFRTVSQRVGEAALAVVRKASPTFVPSTAALEEACAAAREAMPSQGNYISAWDAHTRAQLEERERLGLTVETPKHTRYNLFVRSDNPRFRELCEQAQTSDSRDFAYADGGIWIPLSWWHGRSSINVKLAGAA